MKTFSEIRSILHSHESDLRRQYSITGLSVFGSVVRGEAREDSDVDILATFNQPVGLLKLIDAEYYISDLLGSKVVIEYIDKANPSVTIPKTITMENTPGLDNTRKLTGVADYNLIRSAQQIEIRKIQITTNAGLSYTWTGSYTVDPGIEITLRSSCPAHYYTASQSPIAFESASNFALESIDLDGEGRARYTLDGSGFTYDYYVTDHLGSTREIVNSAGDVTEATMYYPYGTMDYLKPASSTDNAREKFTGKELDAGENPTGEATFDIRITNFDAGSMHYRGELWVNYIDASTTREMLKVYSMFYNPVDRSFTLNTTERFPTEVWITRLQIFTSGAPTPIAYDRPTYNYKILTDHGLTVKLDTDGANLINNPATNYFATTAYTPVRVAGSNLFYFGARYYDPELVVWSSTDPKMQFWNPYGYHTNPTKFVDPNGESFWSFARWLFPVTNSVMSIASAGNAALSQDNFGRGLVAFFSDIGLNEIYNTIGPLFEGVNVTVNVFNNWGSDKWATTFKSIWDNEISSLGNAFNAESFGDFASSLQLSGLNSLYTSAHNFHYQWHKDQKYYGRVEDSHGFSAVVWGRPNEGEYDAITRGNNIVLEKYFYNSNYLSSGYSSEFVADGPGFYATQEATFRHEFIHVRQSSWYGTGGGLLKQTYRKYKKNYTAGSFEHEAIDSYGNSPSWINMLEYEAQSHELRGRSDKYWFDVYGRISF